jgi:predicted alpha/beta hydrolase family esterase
MTTFILVHGTFAKSAQWPSLQDGLEHAARAVGARARFKQITWSGTNRVSARHEASSAISALVHEIKTVSASEEIFIIGHSHGGSAIAYFLKQHVSKARQVTGCAFLSTPFIAIRRREHAAKLLIVLFYPLIIGFMSLWNAAYTPDPFYLDIFDKIDRAPASYWWGFYLTLLAIFWGIFWLNAGLSNRAIDQTIDRQTVDIPTGNYLFLRCSGDEAAAALSAVQFISWLGFKVSRTLSRIMGPMLSGRKAVGFVLSILGAVYLIGMFHFALFFILPDFRNVLSQLAGAFFEHKYDNALAQFMLLVIVLLAPVVVMICLSGALFVLVTQAATAWAFGWTALSTGLSVDLAIEPLPFGAHRLVHVDWNAGPVGLEGMVHSWTYAHPVAIRHVQDWVKSTLSASQIAQQSEM